MERRNPALKVKFIVVLPKYSASCGLLLVAIPSPVKTTWYLALAKALVVSNGTGGTTKSVSHGGSTTFSIGANTGYNLTNASISCTGSASKSISGSVVTIGNVTASQTCTVTLNKNTYSVSIYIFSTWT